MLEEVLALFLQRYGLTEPDGSEGVLAIQGAMRGTVSIAEVRRVLTTKYELYPHYEGRVLEILDSIDKPQAVGMAVETPEEPPSLSSGEAPVKPKRTRGGR